MTTNRKMNQNSPNRNIAILDVETTSIETSTTKVVQIAFLITDSNFTIVNELGTTLANPQIPIPIAARKIHCTSDEMVANAPAFMLIAGSFYNSIKDCDRCF